MPSTPKETLLCTLPLYHLIIDMRYVSISCSSCLKYVLKLCFFQIVKLLLENGAHIDVRNMKNERPLDMLKKVTDCKINPLMYLSLRCLAASTIARNKLPYKKEVPTMLEEFIEAHSGIDLNVRDNTGRTALMIASQRGREDIVRML